MRNLEEGENKVGRNTLLNFLGQSVPLLVGVMAIPFIIHGLGKERFGILALAWGIIVYFNLFDLGLSRAVIKFVSEFLGKGVPEKIPSLVWTSLFFNTLLGLAGGIFLALVTPLLVKSIFNVPTNLLGEARQAFLILAASLPLMTSSRILRGILEGVQRFDLVNAVKAALNSLVFLLPCLALPFHLKLPGIVFLILMANLGALAAYLFLCFRIFPNLKKAISLNRKMLRPLLNFGLWVSVSNVIGPLLVYLDRFLIGSLLTMEAVAYYTAPHEVITKLWILPESLVITLFPLFSSLKAKPGSELASLYAKAVKYLFLIMGVPVLLLALFSKELFLVWLGENFAEQCAPVFQILALGIFVNSLSFIPYNLIHGAGRPDITAKFHLLELPFYIGAAFFLIQKFGIVGAASAWTLRAGVDSLLVFGASWKLSPSTLPALAQNGILRAIVAFSGFTLLTVLAAALNKLLLIKIILAVALTMIFWIIVWKFILDSAEKKYFQALLNFLKRGLG